ncbi:MAG: dATP pyrophosphohydrolase [Gammaproteobacteria bacterium]|nr:dATP pyrophosphohydrolase [Gammaproteobacteria bacterium]
MDRFIKLPMRLHADDPHYVPPLVLERREAFSPRKNPFFHHAEVQFWLACRDGRDVGRISAQIDRLARNPADGHFGLIAAEDDSSVFAALLSAAEQWLRQRGRRRVLGPFNLSINEETGLLIDGFGSPPMLLMGHDKAYVGPRVEAQGYAKAKDVIAYLYDMDHDLPLSARTLIDRPRPPELTVRHLDLRRYNEEIVAITSVFNDAWAGNWGFVPLTDAEVSHMAKSMKPLLDPELVAIVEMRGEPVGFGITLPNLNEAIADLNGRLLPFNWIKLLWRLKVRGTRTARVPLMGVKRSLAGGLVGSLAPFLIIDAMRKTAKKRGIRQVELSWILEDNLPMRRINESLGGLPYKTYRVYEKTLA